MCGVYEWFRVPPTAASLALQPWVPWEVCWQVAEGQQDVSHLSGRCLRGPERLRVTTWGSQILLIVCQNTSAHSVLIHMYLLTHTHTTSLSFSAALPACLLCFHLYVPSPLNLIWFSSVFSFYFGLSFSHECRPSHILVNYTLPDNYSVVVCVCVRVHMHAAPLFKRCLVSPVMPHCGTWLCVFFKGGCVCVCVCVRFLDILEHAWVSDVYQTRVNNTGEFFSLRSDWLYFLYVYALSVCMHTMCGCML